MRYLVLSFAGIIFCVIGIARLNLYVSRLYFNGLTLKGPSINFKPDPSDYARNFYVNTDVKQDDGNYEFTFKFRDENQKDWTWHWSYPVDVTNEMITDFGVPKFIFQPYVPSDTANQRRMNLISKGMFDMENNQIGPDLNKMINFYRPFLEPVSQLVADALGSDNSWRDKAELVIKFVQDIPYGVPPDNQDNRYTAGIFPPPQVFVNMFGDCDSKVVLYAALLSYFDNYDVLILKESGHVLSGIRGIPKPYDKYYEYRNNQYIEAETAGPGRTNLGVITDPYQNILEAIPVKIE